MAESLQPGSQTPPTRVLLLAALLLAVAAWFLLRAYTSSGARECRTLYEAARTPADTARVDTMVTRGSRKQADPHTCGFMRLSARWQ